MIYSNPIFSQGLYLTLESETERTAGSRDGDGEGTGPVSSPVGTIGK